MSHDVTNFLPSDKKRAFTRLYFTRLAVIVSATLLVLTVLHGAFLAPSFVYLSEVHEQAKQELRAYDRVLSSDVATDVSMRLTQLETNAEAVRRASAGKATVAVLEEVLAVRTQGVSTDSYSIDSDAGVLRVRIVGRAATRETLREYHLSLSTLPFVQTADLPLSAYAKETDIPFTITIDGTYTP